MRHRLALAAAPLLALTLTACSPTADLADPSAEMHSDASGQTAAPTPANPTDRPVGLEPVREQTSDAPNCMGNVARYDIWKQDADAEWQWSITGTRRDQTGPSEGATGTADADLTTYDVAPGDSYIGIGARFCIDYIHLQMINHRLGGDLYAGETIRLYPDGDAATYVTDPDAP